MICILSENLHFFPNGSHACCSRISIVKKWKLYIAKEKVYFMEKSYFQIYLTAVILLQKCINSFEILV